MLDAAQPEGAVAVAEEQTAGRGRMGRRWEAPSGSSILVSTVLRPPTERRAPELTLVAGVTVAVVTERATGLAAQVKWPNDVMLDRRKVAGVIAELKDGAVVLGIGLNVNQAPGELPADAKVTAGSLRSVTGREYDRAAILAARDFLRGRRITVDGTAGTAQLIARDGRLEVDTGSGRVLLESGEVLFER
jgi:BirA family biotin operon repressor/biotin-[acetyl-CoA-carboxylase] ligase